MTATATTRRAARPASPRQQELFLRLSREYFDAVKADLTAATDPADTDRLTVLAAWTYEVPATPDARAISPRIDRLIQDLRSLRARARHTTPAPPR